MFGALEVCLLSVFAVGCRTGTRNNEAASRGCVTSVFLHKKKHDSLMTVNNDGPPGFLPPHVIGFRTM